STNRLEESKNIFDTIVNNSTFQGNPNSLLDVHEFILAMFLNVRRNRDIAIYHHFTTAVDTNNIQHVFRDVKANILNNNLIALNLH
ncbi:Guanine nucleotide-binding protein subunit alpha like, partial [Pseudolycoriella hygida]